jgi:ABC-type Na+ efflux pump permease subunit
MNARTLQTIAVKDLKEVEQNRAAWIPALVVPLIFVIALPLGVILIPNLLQSMSPLMAPSGPVGMMRERIPALAAELAGLDERQTWVVLMTGYFFAPFILIFPLMFSTIIGAESFAGERERKTMEALLYTPASDGELFLGKMLAAFVPAVALTWVSFLIYGIVVNAAGWPVMGRIWFPPASWYPLVFWVTPAIAASGVAVTVLISARVRTFMEAYQMSASLVVLVLALVAGQVTGVLYLSLSTALAVGLVLWLIDGVLIILGVRTFRREALLLSR